ncbi:hypothetical protein [Morganella psychrotolerans]|uniref:hypothetical protein n=1 Tax=Morganella psychrotolerans TaxID=368603 RepID=UPI0039B1007C
MTGAVNRKHARILRYYRHQSEQTEAQLTAARKALQQLGSQQAELEQHKAALLLSHCAITAHFSITADTPACRLNTLCQQLSDLNTDKERAESALREHAQITEAAQIHLHVHQRRLKQIDVKQQHIFRCFP